MAEETVVDGRQAFEEDYARIMNDPELRALYEYEAQKKELWLQLVEVCYSERIDAKTDGSVPECLTSASGMY